MKRAQRTRTHACPCFLDPANMCRSTALAGLQRRMIINSASWDLHAAILHGLLILIRLQNSGSPGRSLVQQRRQINLQFPSLWGRNWHLKSP